MAKMTMTYEAKMGILSGESVMKTIISCVKTYGKDKGIYQDSQENDSKYHLFNFRSHPLASIEISEEDVKISNPKGTKRAINRAKSKLLSLVEGLELI